ncbi:hypothetical protein AMS68_001704 [Peltaster fructicola]|uniref:DNA damage-binding protein 1 n=1 Tax=Peltaster fructicola TaxID=286661 RepID=A0A6H0XN59_9PEZI|nr:hypothetical protein AMS68_001704 [Peltaster fructicola]
MAVLEYDHENKRLIQVCLETFGKSGVRRTVPGQYLAADPAGRCFMMASTEKNKLVYMLSRRPDGTVRPSSPHEANSWATINFAMCALDCGTDNPIFAALEVDYTELEADSTGTAYENREKILSYYTVDLGLNHVVRTWSEPVDYTANKLFAVPGGSRGPSGVIVCAKGRLYYVHDKFSSLSVQIPRRAGPLEDASRDRIIVAGILVKTPRGGGFFMLLQTDDGDLFKLTVELDEEVAEPVSLKIKYFDTVPLASYLISLRRGFLYVAAENGPTKLYNVTSLADDDDDEPDNIHESTNVSSDYTQQIQPAYFRHRGIKHLSDTDAAIPALHSLIRTKVDNILGEDSPQIIGLQGRGNESLLKLIKHGNSVHEFGAQPMGERILDNVWSLPESRENPETKLIVVSSRHGQRTEFLAVDGNNFNSLDATPFNKERATVLAANMGHSTKIQVHAKGILSVFPDGRTTDWNPPPHCTIACAAANDLQLIVGLSTGELCYFFMEDTGLLALEDRPEMSSGITALGVADTPHGRDQARFGVVGCDDNSIRVVSILKDNPLEVHSIQAVTAVPVSIVVTDMIDPASGTTVTVCHLGLASGLYLRAIIDDVTGELSQTRSRFLGTQPVHIFSAMVQGQQCVILCTSKTWIGYHHPVSGQYTVAPLDTVGLHAVAPFISENAHVGLCGVVGTELRFIEPAKLGQRFVTEEYKLRYTPRNLARHPTEGVVYVIETDGNTMSKATEASTALAQKESAPPYHDNAPLGNPRAVGHWASCIQVIDLVSPEGKGITNTYELDENESALCCAVVPFESKSSQLYFMVGTGRNMPTPGRPSSAPQGGFVRTYRILDGGKELKFLHKTEFETPIYALMPFQGKLALAVGKMISIYDLGRQHILRRSLGYSVPNFIVSLDAMGNRIVCGDVSQSVTYVVFNEDFNRFVPFCDDTIARWTTTMSMIDYDTTAGGDKFGNLWIVRCPADVSRESDEPGTNGHISNEESYLGGTPNRLECRAHFYTRDIPMSVQRTSLVPGGAEVLFWSGIQGSMGILSPFVARRDVTFFTQLELLMRQHDPSISGRDHLAYRSYYVPVRCVIDGDLIERFLELSYDKKQRIAAECERDVPDIEKKIQEMRTRVAF